MTSLHTPSWYALHVRSRHEKSVAAQLEAKRSEVFLPLYQTRSRWADRWKTVELPLFPGYVFCRFAPAERSLIRATSGLIDIVRVAGEPAPVETGEIEAIRAVVNSSLSIEPYPDLVAGQSVVMAQGPLCGLVGVLTEIRKSLRLVVSIELLRRSVLVEVDRDWAIPTEPVKSRQIHAA
jgi:transcription antitermination factor NusG